MFLVCVASVYTNAMTIYEIREKIKLLQEHLNTREIYTVLLILVVGFGSFGLGRLSKMQEGKLGIRIEQTLSTQTASAASAVSSAPLQRGSTPSSEGRGGDSTAPAPGGTTRTAGAVVQPGGQYVASKGGTKYYFPWCGSASRISEANKIWFSSVEKAREAGYTPASNCKGLK